VETTNYGLWRFSLLSSSEIESRSSVVTRFLLTCSATSPRQWLNYGLWTGSLQDRRDHPVRGVTRHRGHVVAAATTRQIRRLSIRNAERLCTLLLGTAKGTNQNRCQICHLDYVIVDFGSGPVSPRNAGCVAVNVCRLIEYVHVRFFGPAKVGAIG